MASTQSAASLPDSVNRALGDLVNAARDAFGDCLASIVLFGSAVEGRLRATSDVNVIVVLTAFQQPQVERFAPALRVARAAIRLQAMFLLASEIPAAVESFAQKFSDIARRRQVLYGPDPFAGLEPPRAATIYRTRQVLLNLILRLRESYAEQIGRDEQIALLLADAAGPLRTCAATLLELETGAANSPKEALDLIVKSNNNSAWLEALNHISEVREQRKVSPATLTPALFTILEIGEHLRRRIEALG
jgi:predicted nucleotidyltransferase